MKALTTAACFVILALTSHLHAGSRPVAIGLVDATTGERTKEDKRLFELFVKDATEIFRSEKIYPFPWEPNGTVQTLPPRSVEGLFQKMLITDKNKQLAALALKHEVQDGIIVYEYDKAGKQARLKLFDAQGKERLLIRLKLAQKGAMKNSIYKATRRGAVIALGASVEFNP